MNGLTASLLATIAAIIFLLFGVPIAYALGIVGALGLYFTFGWDFLSVTLGGLPFSLASQYTFLIVPMFILMGGVCARTGVITDLYNVFHRLTSGLRGGLYHSTILASAAFGAISGSTVVSASVFSKVALPEMRRHQYHMGLAAGCIAAAGTLAAMIPPSLAMVLFGILTSESIGALLMAGIIPGLMTMFAYMASITILGYLKPKWVPLQHGRISFRQRFSGFGRIIPVAVLSVLVIGGIYAGFFSPSAAGTIGAAGIIVITLLYRRLTSVILRDSIVEAISITGVLFSIVIAGMLFSRFLISTGLIKEFSLVIQQSGITANEFIWICVAIYLVLGMFVDGVSVLVITLPFVYPIAKELSIDPIWLGVIVVKLIEVAAISPPVGLNLFAVLAASQGQVNSREIFFGVLPFVLVEFITLIIIIQFPLLSTWIPQVMMGG